MATDYLEKYIESVADLPPQLQRKFRLIRDLDEKSTKLQADVQDKCRQQLAAAVSGAKSPGGSNKRPRLSPSAPDTVSDTDARLIAEITQGQAQLLSWAEEKMHIAFQVYDLVDKHIRELDEDLKAFAAEVDHEAASLGLGEEETACDRLGWAGGARVRRQGATAAAATTAAGTASAGGVQQGRQKRKTAGRRKGADIAADAMAAAAAAAAAAGGQLQLDAAADASQPRYCLCQNVSYGEMVACDNAECPVEWFHFACVGLTEQPKGKWYCPECAPQFQQGQHGHGHSHGHGHGGHHHHQHPHKKTRR